VPQHLELAVRVVSTLHLTVACSYERHCTEVSAVRLHVCRTQGAMRVPVTDAESAAVLMARAAEARACEATAMNAVSSRSHCVFMLYIAASHAATNTHLSGSLCLVDLAGRWVQALRRVCGCFPSGLQGQSLLTRRILATVVLRSSISAPRTPCRAVLKWNMPCITAILLHAMHHCGTAAMVRVMTCSPQNCVCALQ
jgi:hypothetical protein